MAPSRSIGGGPRAQGGAPSDPDASLRRRLRFEGDCRYAFDRIGAHLGSKASVHRVPERLFVTAFDLFESLRAGRIVPAPGNPRTAVGHAAGRLPQHPRYLGYWHDPERRSLVGMELGVDLIRSGGTYWVLELNLRTGLASRRQMYHAEVDPMVSGVVEFARSHGLRRLVVLRGEWPPGYPEDFRTAGIRAGVDAVAVDTRGTGGGAQHRMVALPDPLQTRTLYVVFSTRHTAIDHFVHDKGCTTGWLAEYLPDDAVPPVRSIPTSSRPFVPGEPTGASWPDLVVKLASWDRGEFVRFVKLRPGGDLLGELGMEGPTDWPGVLGMGIWKRTCAWALARDRILYQPFVPPSLSPSGRPERFRLHMLVTPLGSAFLSAHTVQSACALPEELPVGPVEDPRPFLVSHGKGGRYEPSDAATDADLRWVAVAVGKALHRAVSTTFETGP